MAKSTVLVPGTVLKDLLSSYHIPVAKVSEDIGLSPSAVRQLINGKLKVSIVIALKLAKYFDKKPEYWIDLQTSYELSQLQKDAKVTAGLKTIPKAQKLPAPAPKKAKAAAKPAAKKGPKKAKAAPKAAAAKKPRKAKAKVVKAKPAPAPVSL
jgi:addiction module HigA family antidote